MSTKMSINISPNIPTKTSTTNIEPIIYDTTLREGMQTPGGIGGTNRERIYAANLISRYADWVEIGMPANDVDFAIIRAIGKSFKQNSREAGIAVLCRNKQLDIDRAAESIAGFPRSLAHLFIGTSEEHRKSRFGGRWETSDYESNIRDHVAMAAAKPFTRIMFSPEDSFRTFEQSPDLFFRFVDAALEGYDTSGREEPLVLNFPDTVGKSTIEEFCHDMLDCIVPRYEGKIEISLHPHNDSGAALQQAAVAYLSGRANWLQCVFGGLERGMASLRLKQ
jgi:2-isopropylmalate synthase